MLNHLRSPVHLGGLRRAPRAAALAVFCAACSGETIDLGEVSTDITASPSRCQESARVEGSVLLESQEQIDQLEGCEEIAGNLYIRPLENADFRPLAALKTVGGSLELGRMTVLDSFELPPDVQEHLDEIDEHERALLDAGCFSSLAGFEALERVGRLSLNGVGTPNLLAFSQLSALSDGGVLWVGACANLLNLTGLERLSVVELNLSCNSLESLAGPRFSSRMGDAYIVGPSLVDLGAFSPESINELRIEGTALENLDALSRLARANRIEITSNFALTDADALETLNEIGFLRIADSPLLERLPPLTSMVELDALSIVGNDALTNFPSLPNLGVIPGDTDWGNLAPEHALMLRPDIIEISANPALESIAIPAGWLAASYLDINGNDHLTSIDLANLHAADGLYIAGNAALTNVRLGLLETVDDLRIVANPLLSLEPFDVIQTFSRLVQPGPLDAEQIDQL